jgi:hypothetical protein
VGVGRAARDWALAGLAGVIGGCCLASAVMAVLDFPRYGGAVLAFVAGVASGLWLDRVRDRRR